jgi:polar amino acid transport system substrate-binding protein
MGAAMAERLGVPVKYIPYETAGKLADDAGEDNWDVGLIGADPLRATHVEFTAPYVQIEATYAVPVSSAIQSFEEMDQKGKRVVGCAGAAYVAWLQRNLKAAELTQVEGHDETYQAFLDGGYDALAGLRSKLTKDEAKRPGTKLMDGVLMAVEQAACTKKVRPDGCKWLSAFIEESKTSGKVMELMKQFGVVKELAIPK